MKRRLWGIAMVPWWWLIVTYVAGAAGMLLLYLCIRTAVEGENGGDEEETGS